MEGLTLVLGIVEQLVQLVVISPQLRRVGMAPRVLVHAVEAGERGLLDGVDDAQQELLRAGGVGGGRAASRAGHAMLQGSDVVRRRLVVRVGDGEVERVLRRPPERDLQRQVQMVEVGVGGARQCANHRWVRDVFRSQVEPHDVVRPSAALLVL